MYVVHGMRGKASHSTWDSTCVNQPACSSHPDKPAWTSGIRTCCPGYPRTPQLDVPVTACAFHTRTAVCILLTSLPLLITIDLSEKPCHSGPHQTQPYLRTCYASPFLLLSRSPALGPTPPLYTQVWKGITASQSCAPASRTPAAPSCCSSSSAPAHPPASGWSRTPQHSWQSPPCMNGSSRSGDSEEIRSSVNLPAVQASRCTSNNSSSSTIQRHAPLCSEAHCRMHSKALAQQYKQQQQQWRWLNMQR
jgi:hypothetical protein